MTEFFQAFEIINTPPEPIKGSLANCREVSGFQANTNTSLSGVACRLLTNGDLINQESLYNIRTASRDHRLDKTCLGDSQAAVRDFRAEEIGMKGRALL